jgi:hypothetical protein
MTTFAAPPKVVGYTDILDRSVKAGYAYEVVDAKLRDWWFDGRIALLFENADLSHPECGHVVLLPWDQADGDIPPHSPDHALIGLGWRYITALIAVPDGVSVDTTNGKVTW